jgi:hypothetical protein
MKDNNNDIISLNQFRNRKQEEKKRKTERIFFHNLVGVYGVTQPGKMVPIEIADVSDEGLGILVPYDSSAVWPTVTENLPIRLYFSAESFMEITVDVKNSRPMIEGGYRYTRFGCAVREDQRAYGAWRSFVNFLRAFTEVSEKDSGNISVGSI